MVKILLKIQVKIIYQPDKQGQKLDTQTKMPGGIPLNGGAEKFKQIILKMEKLEKEIHQRIVISFAEVMTINDHEISPE
jgi:hypothetical protein